MKKILPVLVLLSIPAIATSDTITHFPAASSADLTNLLISEGMNIPAFETTATTFTVPGATGSADLTFTFRRDTGVFLFSFGFFDVSTVSANPVTQKELYATQALGSATLVFDDRTVDPGATSTHSVAAGTTLGFFLIPDNTLAAFNASPGSFYPPQTADDPFRSPHFSVSDANPGQFDQMFSFVGNGKTLFTFEDLTRIGASDQDFTDLAFLVDAELRPSVAEPATTMLLLFGLAGGAAIRRRA